MFYSDPYTLRKS